MRRSVPLILFEVLAALSPMTCVAADLAYVETEAALGISAAVVVPQGSGLVQTAQIFPLGLDGAILGGDNPAGQFDAVLAQLKTVLTQAGSGLERIVRLHVYAASENDAAVLRKACAAAFADKPKPAATFVVTPLIPAKALVALDAIAATATPPAGLVRMRVAGVPGNEKLAHYVAIPPGPLVFISGQAEQGDLAQATKKTMQSLHDTLKFLGLDATHVVQVKNFLKPMSEASVAEREIAAFYPEGLGPAVTHVEWTYSSPIEIEMIAVGKPSAVPPADPLKYLAPPNLNHSPVFSRIAVAEGAGLVFVSGLSGMAGMNGEQQVRAIFERLQKVLAASGSDFKHMAKATYYVSQDDPGNALNTLRPQFYDPTRPPAASKAGVKGVAETGVGMVIDMIAVQRRP